MKSFVRSISLCSICAVAFLAAALVSCRAADLSKSTADVTPPSTKVLLLTPIEAARTSVAPLRQQIVRLRQQYEFISRHFAVLGETAAANACAIKPVLTIENSSDRSAEVLDELAVRAGADWVVSIEVKEIAIDELDPPDVSINFVRCTVMLRVRDTRRHTWLANRDYTGRIFAMGPPPELFIDALDTTTGEALATVLWPYPVVVPVSRNGLIVDYLKGATEPTLAHPGRIFAGWNAAEIARPKP